MFPRRRENGLLIEELAGETLVYDRRTHEAHCLNETAAFVWRHCDGRTGLRVLADRVRSRFGCGRGAAGLVRAAICDLRDAGLLEKTPDLPHLSRRELVRHLARWGAALPVIVSLVAPLAAQATAITPGQCNTGGPTMVGRCCTNQKTCVAVGKGGNQQCNGAPC